jgi:thymidylate synthase
MSEEMQYLNLIKRVIEKGSFENTRNGLTKGVFGEYMRFSLANGTVPLITSKRVAWKTCFQELMWFLRGDTDNRNLQKVGVHIWDGNSTREFLDGRGLNDYPEGILGPIYGWQWRRWNEPYTPKLREESTNASQESEGGGRGGNLRFPYPSDQIQNLINDLKDPRKRSSRRLIVSAWNPEQIDQMALPPCHVMMQFHVRDGNYLSCALFQRSGDIGLGVPFNIASYSFLTHLLAKHCDLVADEFVYFLGDAHIYEQHIQPLQEQLSKEAELFPFPKLRIRQKRDQIEEYTLDDLEWVEQYQSHATVKMDFVP